MSKPLTLDRIFQILERDVPGAFRHGPALGHTWVMSSATYAEVYELVRREYDPTELPPVEDVVLMGQPIRIDESAEGLSVEALA